MAYTREQVKAAQKILDQWHVEFYDGILTVCELIGDWAEYGRYARELYDLVRPIRGTTEWHPDTSSALMTRCVAETIVIRARAARAVPIEYLEREEIVECPYCNTVIYTTPLTDPLKKHRKYCAEWVEEPEAK